MSMSQLINSTLEAGNNGTTESENSDDECLSDFTKLQSYMYELCVSKASVKENYPGKQSSDSEEGTGNIGNTHWCSCGKYKPMATHTESICCLDKHEIRKSSKVYFQLFLN